MKHIISFLLFFVYFHIFGQLIRYPYIQSTSKNSTIVAWKTATNTVGEVRYGIDPNNLTNSVLEGSSTQLHGITLEGLIPNTKYYYAIYSNNNLMASEYFWTAPDSTITSYSFLHYGDCGYNNTMQRQIGTLMEADDASFAVITGDIDQGGIPHVSAGSGGDDYDEIFFNVYNDGTNSKMLSRECHYPSIGNHDVYHDNGATYENEFFLPHNNAQQSERYYSFEWGNAKFIALDVITPFDPTILPINQAPIEDRWWTDFRPGSPQYLFLRQELQCNDKEWVFVYFHEGPWTNYWGADYSIPSNLGGDYYQFTGNTLARQYLVPLFEQYDVDVVLCGHSHLYERGERNGVLYVTSGSAGDADVNANVQRASHPEILLSILDNAYAKFTVNQNNLNITAINKNNQVIDNLNTSKTFIPFQLNEQITNASCINGEDGSASIFPSGNKAPYTVEWFDGTTGNTISNKNPGIYYAYVRNVYGCEKVISITIGNDNTLPSVSFQYANNGGSYSFISNNTSASSYFWDFGDGTTETSTSPIATHSYTSNGTYQVSLSITTACGNNTYTVTIMVTDIVTVNNPHQSEELYFELNPNLSADYVQLIIPNISESYTIELLNMQAIKIDAFEITGGNHTIQLQHYPAGTYLLKLSDSKGNWSSKLLQVYK